MRNPQIDALFANFISPDTPGAAVLVAHNGQIVYQAGYGLARLDTQTHNTPNTIFHLASAGKQFTGLALMMLAEAGQLNYDDPVVKHLPELEATLGSVVTLRHLLHHTGGVSDYYGNDDFIARFPTPTNAEMLTFLSEQGGLEFTPGDRFEYSNSGYDILGSVIERVAGQTFGAFMQTRVFQRLGMTSTFSYDPQRLADPARALGYAPEGDHFDLYDSDSLDQLVGSGSIFSSVADLFRYDQALYTETLVKHASLTAAIQSGRLNDGSLTDYGFGWEVGQYAGTAYMGHSGSWVGFTSYMLRFPDQKLSVFVLSNRADTEAETLATQVADLYLK